MDVSRNRKLLKQLKNLIERYFSDSLDVEFSSDAMLVKIKEGKDGHSGGSSAGYHSE